MYNEFQGNLSWETLYQKIVEKPNFLLQIIGLDVSNYILQYTVFLILKR